MTPNDRAKMSQREKFELINSEVRSFYEYCKEAGMSEKEMDLLCRPLTTAVRKATIKKWTIIMLLVAAAVAVLYALLSTDYIQWRAAAVARILLIKALPAIYMRPLYQNKCVIEASKPIVVENGVSSSECVACEAIKTIARLSSTSYNEVFNHHLLRGAPVIVTDAYHDWSSRAEFNLTRLISDDDRLLDSVPCRSLTNLRLGPMNLEEIVSRITNADIPSWFVHFQNCDLHAVKSFRVLAPRPYFLAPYVPPSHFNWLLLSKNYDTHRYKTLELDAGLIIMSQLKGKTHVQLKPRVPCEDECYTLSFELNEGETLVLGNSLWEFAYLPGKGENAAMITETDWNDS